MCVCVCVVENPKSDLKVISANLNGGDQLRRKGGRGGSPLGKCVCVVENPKSKE